jgi:RNA polymerase sigma-70 factor, ECF subfamily
MAMSVTEPVLAAVAGPVAGGDDAAIIAESLAEPERFAVLYDRYADQLYRYAGRRLGAADAEDMIAATFLAAFRARGRFDTSRADARPWLFGILTKELAKQHRRESARLRAIARACPDVAEAGHADKVADDVTARGARKALAQALSVLAPADRSVLLLIAWGDLTYDEVAHALAIPVGTVRSRLNRARRKVREALGGNDPTRVTEMP